jgi:hypothetical protein
MSKPDQLVRLRDAIRSLDFVDERIFEEVSTLNDVYERACFDKTPLDKAKVERVRFALPQLLSALGGAMTAIDDALAEDI